jgi:hypothetical protein
MATEQQILANQQNAKHSTGPRTESGNAARGQMPFVARAATDNTPPDAVC